jgi:hypothetical protein
VGQPPDHGVTGCPFASAPAAPLVRSVVRLDNQTRQHGAIRFEPLADDFEAELVKTAERGQVRAGEGGVRHVEVFPMGGAGTPIIGRAEWT